MDDSAFFSVVLKKDSAYNERMTAYNNKYAIQTYLVFKVFVSNFYQPQ